MNAAPALLYLVSEDWYFRSHRLPIALAAREAGFRVHLAARLGRDAQALADLGFELHPLDLRRGDTRVWREVPLLASLARLYRRLRPAIAHHVALKPVLYGSLVAPFSASTQVVNALAGLGYLFTSETARRSLPARAVRAALPRLVAGTRRRVIVQNPDDRALMRSLGVAAERIHLIQGSGVDTRRFAPSAEPAGTPLAVMVSRLLYDKGVAELVEAARMLRARGVALRIALVGAPDPDNPASVEPATLADWAEEGVVELWGQRDDIDAIWRQAHIGVLPSYREGLPKALLEAAASGRPLVATDVTGCREVARHGETALTVPPRDAAALADALQQLAGDAVLRARLGAGARAAVLQSFSVERVVNDTLALYHQMLAGAVPGRD